MSSRWRIWDECADVLFAIKLKVGRVVALMVIENQNTITPDNPGLCIYV